MVQVLVWMIMSYGLSNILVYGSIFNRPRNYIFNEADHGIGFLTGFYQDRKSVV
jgi:hypothetical protein